MVELSSYHFEKLREDGEFVVSRGTQTRDAGSILLVTLASEYPSRSSIDRIHNAYSVARELEADWAVRPLGLVNRGGGPALVLEDPGGEFLDTAFQRPLPLKEALRLAVAIAAALGRLHGRQMIHRDCKPANIVVNRATGQAWLAGFGLTLRLPRYRQPPEPPDTIAGTLAYMAPEQTGRMNRSIDSRSDLYSLGVTLYEMFVGELPFTADDPMAWVHCHLARLPTAPHLRRSDIPQPLSDLIMKLLAKAPEERYQTAIGVEADLRQCLERLGTRRSIGPFVLGTRDVPDRLLIPEKLYGREREIDLLLAAFERVVKGGRRELVLVSGYSGVGKSSVVHELHKALVPRRGLFASGKFDQSKRDVPYSTLAQAFQSLVHPLLGKGEQELCAWREALRGALGKNGSLVLDLVPALRHVIGEQLPAPDIPPRDAQRRFHLTIRHFIDVFARPEHPLVLFLDDLQWIDAATLDLVEDLLSSTDAQPLVLIGAYRDNEVDSTHPLMRKLESMRRAGSALQDIALAPLGRDDIGQLVAGSLRCEFSRAFPLAELVHEKTTGNPFFAIQFISALADEGLLSFDYEAARWSWDLTRIHSKGYTDNVVHLMVGKLNGLPVEAQEALQQLACLGSTADFELLGTVCLARDEELHSRLREATLGGFVVRSETSYRFLHDRIQEAAYSLIPEDARAPTHLRIGRLLADHTAPERLEEAIFDVVNQLNRGTHLITSPEERERVARLNLIAGRRAKASTAYAVAMNYLAIARSILPADAWDTNYALIFSIESHLAECEVLTARLSAAETRLATLSERAGTRGDVARVTRLQLTLYTTLDRSERAIEVFLEYLRRGGTDWPQHPTHEDVMGEYDRIWSLLGGRQVEDLASLPPMTDPDVLDMLDVFTEIVHPALFYDENLSSLVVCRMVTLSLEYGNCDASCFGFVWFAMLAGPRFDNYRDGFRFGQLGYDLIERGGFMRYRARTYISFATLLPWAKHAAGGRELVRRAYDVAYEVGDLTFSAYSWHVLITNYLTVGDALAEVQAEAENGLAFCRKAGFGLVADNCGAQLGLVRMLRGLTTKFGSFDDEQYDEAEVERRLAGNPTLAIAEFFFWTRKLQGRFFARDYMSAVGCSERAARLLWTATSQVETGDFRFYAALAHAGAWGSASTEEKGRHVEAMTCHHRQLRVWAEHCHANFDNRAALVGAEIARIEGRTLEAEDLYEEAVRSSRENGFVHHEAVALELAAGFYMRRGFEMIADAYLRHARSRYLRWGADGKVKQLDALYPQLSEDRTSGAKHTIGSAIEHLDLATVIKVSEAVSGEMELGKLIDTLMRTAIEHAGAEKGLLILLRGADFQIEAEATVVSASVTVALRQAKVSGDALPESVFQYVRRTQESVLLHNASDDSPFASDDYVHRHRARSVLCLPLLKQKKLVGMLYLENNLTPRAFTPGRVAVLKLLASQAATSLENAALCTDLQLQVGLLQSLPVSAWTLKPDGTPDFVNQVWLEFAGQSADVVRSHPEAWMTAVHPDDRAAAAKIFWQGVHSGRDFSVETRSLRARDGAYRWHLNQAVALRDSDGKVLRFVGTTTDIDDQKRAEENLRQSQAELARVSRVTTMGELAASIAHEITQPLSGIMTNAGTCLRMLAADPPHLEGARETARRTIRDGHRASDVINRLRALFTRKETAAEAVDLNEATREVIVLMRGELQRNQVSLRPDFAEDLPSVIGDRVQLQQVILNLLLNASEAMCGVNDRPRQVVVRTGRDDGDRVRLDVSDVGVGFAPHEAEQLFRAFYTTKSGGMGIGLSVSRSIIEGHRGRIWASRNKGPGATFSISVPCGPGHPSTATPPHIPQEE